MASIGGMGNLLKQAQEMQARMAKIQEELGQKTVEGSAGGGMVQVTVNGQFNLTVVTNRSVRYQGRRKGNARRPDLGGGQRRYAQGTRDGFGRNGQAYRWIQNSRPDAVT